MESGGKVQSGPSERGKRCGGRSGKPVSPGWGSRWCGVAVGGVVDRGEEPLGSNRGSGSRFPD